MEQRLITLEQQMNKVISKLENGVLHNTLENKNDIKAMKEDLQQYQIARIEQGGKLDSEIQNIKGILTTRSKLDSLLIKFAIGSFGTFIAFCFSIVCYVSTHPEIAEVIQKIIGG